MPAHTVLVKSVCRKVCPNLWLLLYLPQHTYFNAATAAYWHLKGHGCSLVVIRETAQQVRVAAILVSEACSAWHAADRITTGTDFIFFELGVRSCLFPLHPRGVQNKARARPYPQFQKWVEGYTLHICPYLRYTTNTFCRTPTAKNSMSKYILAQAFCQHTVLVQTKFWKWSSPV